MSSQDEPNRPGAAGAIIANRPKSWTASWIIEMYDAAKEIKARVDIRDVAESYGVHFNDKWQGKCPFHDDRHPSASIKNGRFHCYVCDLHLDIFEFVQQFDGCSFNGAKERLNSLFHLGLDLKKPMSSAEMDRLRQERQKREAEIAAYRAEYEAKQAEFIRLYRLPAPPPDNPSWGEYARLLGRLDYLEWWFTENRWR